MPLGATEQAVSPLGLDGGMIRLSGKEYFGGLPTLRHGAYYGYRHIPVAGTQDEPYPWKGDICLLDRNLAVIHDTDNVDSKVLGNNSRRWPLFGRQNTRTPIRVDKYAIVNKSRKIRLIGLLWTHDQREEYNFLRDLSH